MAIHRVAIPGPFYSANGNAYPSLMTNVVSGSTQDFPLWVFQDAVTGTIQGLLPIPTNYVSTPKLIILWSSPTAAGNVVWDIVHRTMTPGTDLLDTSTSPAEINETNLATASKPGAADRLEEDEIALTTTDLVADELLYFEFSRIGGDASDTKTDDAYVVGLLFEYADA